MKKNKIWFFKITPLLAALVLLAAACAPYHAGKRPLTYKAKGVASWYGPGFNGKKTANGERFYPSALTAAHRTLPLGSTVRVTNLENDKSVVVRINDRGPFSGGRLIDLSKGAAEQIGLIGPGTAKVEVVALYAPDNVEVKDSKSDSSDF